MQRQNHHTSQRNQNIPKSLLFPSLPVSSFLTQVKSRQNTFQGHVPFSCDKNWNAPLDPPVSNVLHLPQRTGGRMERSYLRELQRGVGGKRRALASYAILLTLNQYLSESMDALKSKFQGKIFSAALRKGLVRLWTVKKKKNEPCCKVKTNGL